MNATINLQCYSIGNFSWCEFDPKRIDELNYAVENGMPVALKTDLGEIIGNISVSNKIEYCKELTDVMRNDTKKREAYIKRVNDEFKGGNDE